MGAHLQEHRRMTARQFRQALKHIGVDAEEFSFLYGTTPKRARAWLKGDEDIPIHFDILLSLMSRPHAMEIVNRIIDRERIAS